MAGLAGNAQVGTLLTATALFGVVCTGELGTLVHEIDAAIAGVNGTGQIATITGLVMAGAGGVGQSGTFAKEIDKLLSGTMGSGQAGAIQSEYALEALVGAPASGQLGSLTTDLALTVRFGAVGFGESGFIFDKVSFSFSGAGGIGQTGVATANAGGTIVGGACLGQAGSTTAEIGGSFAGVEGIGDGGVAQASGSVVSATGYGQAGIAQIEISNPAGADAAITGVAGTGQAGDVEAYISSIFGVEATGSAGTADIAIGPVDEIIVSLYSDNAGVPGTFIEVIGSFFDAAVSTEPTTITLSPTNPIPLTPNTRYWVQVVNTLTSTVRWVTLSNDGGAGVATEFWYKSSGESGANSAGPAYQMAVFSESLFGVGGTGQVGSLTIQSGTAAVAGITGVEGLGQAGTVRATGKKKRGGRGADNRNFKPALFSKPEERETDVQALTRWRKIVDDLLELPPRQAEETGQPEPDRPSEQDFSFLNSLDLEPSDQSDEPVAEATDNWRAIAEADDLLLLGDCLDGCGRAEADDLLLLGDWL